jgi:hypothetical protein
MAKFTDNNGREWITPVTRASIERAQSISGVNICEVLAGELFDRLQWDDLLVGRILWGICKPEADQANISQEQFYEAIQGEPIDAGTGAILEGLDGFFSRRKKLVLRQMRAMVREADAARKQAMTSFRDAMGNLSASGSSDSVTTMPESSE